MWATIKNYAIPKGGGKVGENEVVFNANFTADDKGHLKKSCASLQGKLARRKLVVALTEDTECFQAFKALLRRQRVSTHVALAEILRSEGRVLEQLADWVMERGVTMSKQKQRETGCFPHEPVWVSNTGANLLNSLKGLVQQQGQQNYDPYQSEYTVVGKRGSTGSRKGTYPRLLSTSRDSMTLGSLKPAVDHKRRSTTTVSTVRSSINSARDSLLSEPSNSMYMSASFDASSSWSDWNMSSKTMSQSLQNTLSADVNDDSSRLGSSVMARKGKAGVGFKLGRGGGGLGRIVGRRGSSSSRQDPAEASWEQFIEDSQTCEDSSFMMPGVVFEEDEDEPLQMLTVAERRRRMSKTVTALDQNLLEGFPTKSSQTDFSQCEASANAPRRPSRNFFSAIIPENSKQQHENQKKKTNP